MARHSLLRASDADREAVTERLRAAAVEGRLEAWELEERVGRALSARTYGELDRLLRDLPAGRRRSSGVALTAFGLTVRLIVLFVVVSAVIVAAALSAAWWLLCALVWLTLRGGRASRPRRTIHRHRPAHPF